MSRIELIAELATSHGGDVSLAEDMIAAAAEAGAHTVKIQSYTLTRLNPNDPQADWLRKSHLGETDHKRLIEACRRHGVEFLSTPFDRDSLLMLLRLAPGRIKVASTQSVWNVSDDAFVGFIKSWPWGQKAYSGRHVVANLTAIPLYPTPPEAVCRAPLLDGWSDHTEGTAACKHVISKGAKIIEAHFCLPGRSRQMPWDKTPEQFREIREWAETVCTLETGISRTFRERWTA